MATVLLNSSHQLIPSVQTLTGYAFNEFDSVRSSDILLNNKAAGEVSVCRETFCCLENIKARTGRSEIRKFINWCGKLEVAWKQFSCSKINEPVGLTNGDICNSSNVTNFYKRKKQQHNITALKHPNFLCEETLF